MIMDLFKPSQDITKQRKRKKNKQNNSRDDKEFFEYICNIFNFLTISNQPHKLLTVSLVGGGVACVGRPVGLGSRSPGASLLGLQAQSHTRC